MRFNPHHFAAPELTCLFAEEYKPLLKEIEKILAEAGLDEEEIKRAGAGTSAGAQGQSRNRR